MADGFDPKIYKEEYDNIKLTQEQKNILLAKIRKPERNSDNNYSKSEKALDVFYNVWMKAAAVTLAVALIGSAAYFCLNNNTDNLHKNSFSFVVSAAETGKNTEITDSEIGFSSGMSTSGFALKNFTDSGVEIYPNKQGKSDYFIEYELTDLYVVGENIDTVTFTANKDYTYFVLYPGNTNDEEFDLQQWINSNFSQVKPLTNSQYSSDELDEHGDGMYGVFCDSFTYKNNNDAEGEQRISMNKLAELVIETDRTDDDIDKWMEKFCIASDENLEHKVQRYYETGGVGGGEISDAEKKNEEIMQENLDKIVKKTLENATVDVTVKFNDGTEDKKTIILGYEKTEDGYYWITARLAK